MFGRPDASTQRATAAAAAAAPRCLVDAAVAQQSACSRLTDAAAALLEIAL